MVNGLTTRNNTVDDGRTASQLRYICAHQQLPELGRNRRALGHRRVHRRVVQTSERIRRGRGRWHGVAGCPTHCRRSRCSASSGIVVVVVVIGANRKVQCIEQVVVIGVAG
jgi:hypothetical protein